LPFPEERVRDRREVRVALRAPPGGVQLPVAGAARFHAEEAVRAGAEVGGVEAEVVDGVRVADVAEAPREGAELESVLLVELALEHFLVALDVGEAVADLDVERHVLGGRGAGEEERRQEAGEEESFRAHLRLLLLQQLRRPVGAVDRHVAGRAVPPAREGDVVRRRGLRAEGARRERGMTLEAEEVDPGPGEHLGVVGAVRLVAGEAPAGHPAVVGPPCS
jgi:hypothetical protein